MGFAFSLSQGLPGRSGLRKMLLKHFDLPAGEIATSGRQFPITARVDIQFALEQLLRDRTARKLLGIVSPNPHEAPQLAQMLAGGHFPIEAGPLQYDEIDVGEPVPVRCLKCGLWLWQDDSLPVAILMAPGGRFGLYSGVQLEIAVPVGEPGARLSEEFFRQLEILVSQGRSYRGRIISLEAHIHPMGGGSMVKVHRLPTVNREDVILPSTTLSILDRNVAGFMTAREQLMALGFQAHKGLLFYGPPDPETFCTSSLHH